MKTIKKGRVHFIGIGGISMSSLAEMLISRGYKISGSDIKASDLTEKLEKLGAMMYIGQRSENIKGDEELVVYTAAVHSDNPEYSRVVELGIPLISRAELLGMVMGEYEHSVAVAGTHGKTTTTSMISEIFISGQKSPTLSLGGILPSINSNYLVGDSSYFICEACEYTNSYHSLKPYVGIILNVDADHLDFFKDLEDIRASFRKFAGLVQPEGYLIINGDMDRVEEIYKEIPCKNIITFGNDKKNDYYPEKITVNEMGNCCFEVKGKQYTLSIPGEHNVYNALAAIACADIFEIKHDAASKALNSFRGSKRRFEHRGEWKIIRDDGEHHVKVVDDYAHHPTEIRATIKAAEKYPHREGGMWVVFQPHTYTRTKSLLTEFAEALSLCDHVVLADIYAARETDDLGISSGLLAERICENGGDAVYCGDYNSICSYLKKNCINGDMLITMGAGDVDIVGDMLLSEKL